MEKYEKLVADLYAYFNGKDVKYLFCHGGCFYFAKKVAEMLDGAVIMWNQQLMHCAVLYRQGLYDITGRISKKGFTEADEKAMLYMQKHFIPNFDTKSLDQYLNASMLKKEA